MMKVLPRSQPTTFILISSKKSASIALMDMAFLANLIAIENRIFVTTDNTLLLQVISLLLALVLKSLVSSKEEDDDIEGDYGYRNREPLLSPYSGQASGSARGDSDIWSSRMREKVSTR